MATLTAPLIGTPTFFEPMAKRELIDLLAGSRAEDPVQYENLVRHLRAVLASAPEMCGRAEAKWLVENPNTQALVPVSLQRWLQPDDVPLANTTQLAPATTPVAERDPPEKPPSRRGNKAGRPPGPTAEWKRAETYLNEGGWKNCESITYKMAKEAKVSISTLRRASKSEKFKNGCSEFLKFPKPKATSG
ncbi:MAG: hypothetical protein WA459_25185 [Stellaceae bacterium]